MQFVIFEKMKRTNILFSLLFLVSLCVDAQIAKPEKGSVWVFNYSNAGIGGPLVAVYDRDTVLVGKQAMIFKQTLFNRYKHPNDPKRDTIDWSQNIIALEDSAVLWWDNDQYKLVYDFGESIGTKRTIRSYERDTLTVETIEKGVHEHLGCFQVLTYRYRNLLDENKLELKDTVYERLLGGSAYILPEKQIAQFLDGQEGGPLQCFSNSKGRYSDRTWTAGGSACTDIIEKLSVDQIAKDNLFAIYPNPSQGRISISTNQKPTRMEVYSTLGELVFSSETEFETQTLSPQLYVVKLWRNDGLVEAHRVVVE